MWTLLPLIYQRIYLCAIAVKKQEASDEFAGAAAVCRSAPRLGKLEKNKFAGASRGCRATSRIADSENNANLSMAGSACVILVES